MKRLLLLVLLAPLAAAAQVSYYLRPDLPSGSVRVAIRLEKASDREEFRIPAWCPGFYFILQYQDDISDFRATDGQGRKLTVTKSDSRGWVVSNPAKGAISVSYKVLGDDPGLGFFATSVKSHTVFVNPPSAFMYVEGRKDEPTKLKLELPKGWKVATGMSQADDGTWTAQGYEELIDHPLQLGIFESRRFTVRGVPFEAAFVAPTPGGQRADLDAEVERLKQLSEPAIKLFGGFPAKKYVYIIHLATGDFGGGLEHRASTVLAVPNSKPLGIDTLATHELFHTWNVKHARPKVLGPFDYTQPVRTNNLWFAEGVTDYYANITAYRSGYYDSKWLLRSLSDEISTLQSSKMRKVKTLEEASWNAWENGGFGIGDLSYYNKGLLAGLLFDAAIRSATNGAKSLDDVMRLLYSRHKLPNPGYEEDEILAIMNEVAGTDLAKLYKRIAQSTEELPYDVLLPMGLRVVQQGERSVLEPDPAAGPKAASLLSGWLAR